MQIIDSTPAALSADLQMYLRNGDVFFDIETTGLSWRTSHLYLIGALFFDPAADTFTLRQWFLDRPTEEKEMLVSFFTFLSDVKQLVHFNGTTFDLPYLTHKALFYQMEDPLSSIASLDLYQALRPFQSILGLSSMKQKNVEQYLSFPRKDQLNGKQLILVYHDYLQTLDEKKLELLFFTIVRMSSAWVLFWNCSRFLPCFTAIFLSSRVVLPDRHWKFHYSPSGKFRFSSPVSARMVLLQPLVHGFLSPCRRIRRS